MVCLSSEMHDHRHTHDHDHEHEHAGAAGPQSRPVAVEQPLNPPRGLEDPQGPAAPDRDLLANEGPARRRKFGRGGLIGLGISGGIVPCPAALAVVSAMIGRAGGLAALGTVLLFSAGMGLVLIAIGVGLVKFKQVAGQRVASRRPGVAAVLPVISAGLITLLGVGLLVLAILRPGLEEHVPKLTASMAVILGALHALEPGHGKALVAAYLVGSAGRVVDAVILGAIVTVMHTGTAIVLGLVEAVFSEAARGPAIQVLQIISAALVVLVGGWMFWSLARGTQHRHCQHMHEEHDH